MNSTILYSTKIDITKINETTVQDILVLFVTKGWIATNGEK